MNRYADFVLRHAPLAWLIVLPLSLAAALGTNHLIRDLREHERLSLLETEAARRGAEIMALTLNGNLMGALGLLGIVEARLKREVRGELPPNHPDTLKLLENVARLRDAEGAFVVNREGIIGSSWAPGRSASGQDVRFRPYVRTALDGHESVYAAVGTTSGRRTLYFAAPLRAGDAGSAVIGVVAGRGGVDGIDRLLDGPADIALLLSPQGVVFAGNRPEWIGHLVGEPTPARIAAIRELRQFGNMFDTREPPALPLATEPGIHPVEGVRHAVARLPVRWNDPAGDWTLLLMEDLDRSAPLRERLAAASLAGFLTLLLGTLAVKVARGQVRQGLANEALARHAREQEDHAERKSRLTGAAVRLQQALDQADLVRVFLTECHRMAQTLQGVVYVLDPSGRLHLAGDYALDHPPAPSLALGEGLLGQCAADRRARVIQPVPADYALVRSGLGEAPPAALLLLPILLSERLLGALELALPAPPDEATRHQLAELTRLLAMNLEIIGRGAQVEAMLAATQEAERRSAEQLAFQQALIDAIPYPVFYKGPDARFRGFNRAYEAAFNVRREDLVGKRVLDLDYLPEADRLAYQEEDEATIAGVGSVRREMDMPFADGRIHRTLYFVSGFRRPDGSPGGLVGTFIDQGERP